jgi:hypothetical protein
MSLHDKLSVPFALAVLAWAPAALARPPQQQIQVQEDESEDEECPEAVRGVELALIPVSGGARMDFTTKHKDQLDDLRLLLREAGATMEYHSKLIALHPDLVSSEDEVIPPVNVEAKDLPNGIEVTIRAETPGDANRVMQHARKLKEAWGENECVRTATGAQRTRI